MRVLVECNHPLPPPGSRGWTESFLYPEDVRTLLHALHCRRISCFPVLEDGTPLMIPSAPFLEAVRNSHHAPPLLVLPAGDPGFLFQQLLLWCHCHLNLHWAHLLLAFRQARRLGIPQEALLNLPLSWGQTERWLSRYEHLADLLERLGEGGIHWDQNMLLALAGWSGEEARMLTIWASRFRFSRAQTRTFWDAMSQIRALKTSMGMDRFHRRWSSSPPKDTATLLATLHCLLHPLQTRRNRDMAREIQNLSLPEHLSLDLNEGSPDRPLVLHIHLRNTATLKSLLERMPPCS